MVLPAESAPSGAWQEAVTEVGCSGPPGTDAPSSVPCDSDAEAGVDAVSGPAVRNQARPTPTSTRHTTPAATAIHFPVESVPGVGGGGGGTGGAGGAHAPPGVPPQLSYVMRGPSSSRCPH